MWRLVVVLLLSLNACDRDLYTVVERKNDPDAGWLNVVLVHGNRKLYTTCNNYKGAGNYKAAETKMIFRCGLHVGDTVRCKSFPNREEGYDLICGNELVNGVLTSSGRNELLLIEREELLRK